MYYPSVHKYTKHVVVLANFSELNDTIVEAELRILTIPLSLPVDIAKENFRKSKNRLLVMVSSSCIYLHTLILCCHTETFLFTDADTFVGQHVT